MGIKITASKNKCSACEGCPKDDTLFMIYECSWEQHGRPGVGSARAVFKIDFWGIFAIIYLTGEPEGIHYIPAPANS